MRICPVFVVGKVRSGTTLISMMLSAHPSIAIAPDMHYIPHWVQRYRHLDLSQLDDFEQFWKALTENKRFGYLGIDAAAVREHIEIYHLRNFSGIYMSILEAYAAAMHKPRWGEKTPFTAEYMDTLFDWFPDARVIYMLRDPRAVVSSLRKVPWLADVGVRKHALSWADQVRRALETGGDPRVLRVRYEHLVQEPHEALQRVCQFLDEEYSPEMLYSRDSLQASTLRGREGWEREHIRAAMGPVHKVSIEKWRNELTPIEIAEIEQVCGVVMKQAGYRPSENLPSASRQECV